MRFEYLKVKGNTIYTRPMSRKFVTLTQTSAGLDATMNTPSLNFALLELHKGHGPMAFRYYQIFVAIALMLAVLGGVAVGLLAKAYRGQTLVATLSGTVLALGLILM